MAPIYNPSLEEFLTRARHAFGFLGAEFAFHEQPLTLDPDVNPYQVRYVNTTTLVRVEGINWGYGVTVLLGPWRRPIFRRENTFPLWPIVKLRRPDLYDRLDIGDQLEQLTAYAMALRECAAEVLAGDFSVGAEVERLLRQQTATGKGELGDWLYSKAVKEADEAFRSRDYQRVITLLTAHEGRLSPAQRLKLQYAKKNRG
jgi:hypothetical protein